MAEIKFTSRLVPTTADKVLIEAPYVIDENLGKLQSEINRDILNRISQGLLYSYKGTVETYDDLLAIENPIPGDVYNVRTEINLPGMSYSAGTNFAWVREDDGYSRWDALGGTIDSSLLEEKFDELGESSKLYTDTQLSNHISWEEMD